MGGPWDARRSLQPPVVILEYVMPIPPRMKVCPYPTLACVMRGGATWLACVEAMPLRHRSRVSVLVKACLLSNHSYPYIRTRVPHASLRMQAFDFGGVGES